ncbi:peroxide stress protein YaaA [bacterium]|nr:peroxide stress protein YaaA [bacterium]
MLALLSPSKTLSFEDDLPLPFRTKELSTSPALLKETKRLVPLLKKLSEEELQKLMKISPKLAALNRERYRDFSATPKPRGSREALLAFRGDVYEGFPLESYTKRDYESAQHRVRILSGLYGLLRPLDRILPYRLEMGTSLSNPRGKNLYDFWGERITAEVERAVEESRAKYVLNLASIEYAKSVHFEELSVPTITVDFKDEREGKLKTIGLFAKKARGKFANAVVQKQLETEKEIRKITFDGYRFQKALSSEGRYVYVRSAPR